ncbi:RNA polymerase sigma factor [Dethiothermospora halolimnae]|uniref:RNA polymerase sigma factor n=1 Tax=Dethiothermospora halolimnae TaxID=3114390 RepID=UPI003CCC2484
MDEEKIVIALQRGNKEVFPKLIDSYKKRIFAMAYKFTNDYNETQDLAQEIFLKVYKEIKTFKFQSKLSTWIYIIANNTCLDWKRKNSKKILVDISNIVDTTADLNNQGDDIPEDNIIKSEYQREIHHTIYRLPDIYKSVIIMYHFNNMSYKDISIALDISEKTVETRLYRGRKLLKDKIDKLNSGVITYEM